MRLWFVIAATVASLSVAQAAQAAPTCQRVDGLTARCGTPGAMPVGWRPSPEQLMQRRLSRPPEDLSFEVIGSFCLLGALATLIALMPNFDGWTDGDWDDQEGDRRRR